MASWIGFRWLRIRQSVSNIQIKNQLDGRIDFDERDPVQFCTLLHEECQRLGVQFLFQSSATRVHVTGETGLSSIDIESSTTKDTVKLPCHNLLISAGSWTDRVFSKLFPDANCRVPMTKQQPAQNWLRFAKQDSEPKARGVSEQVWFSPAIKEELHISSFLDGELYIAGAFEDCDLVDLPEDLRPDPNEVTELESLASKYLHIDRDKGLKLTGSGRAYMPRTSNHLPIITKVAWNRLFLKENLPAQDTSGGVFLNVGQYLDGFTLGLASGKVMSELIRREKTSVELAPFELPLEASLSKL